MKQKKQKMRPTSGQLEELQELVVEKEGNEGVEFFANLINSYGYSDNTFDQNMGEEVVKFLYDPWYLDNYPPALDRLAREIRGWPRCKCHVCDCDQPGVRRDDEGNLSCEDCLTFYTDPDGNAYCGRQDLEPPDPDPRGEWSVWHAYRDYLIKRYETFTDARRAMFAINWPPDEFGRLDTSEYEVRHLVDRKWRPVDENGDLISENDAEDNDWYRCRDDDDDDDDHG